MTSLINQKKLRFNSGSMYYIPRGKTAESSEVSISSVTDLGIAPNRFRLFWPLQALNPVTDVFLWGWHQLPPSFIPITRAENSLHPHQRSSKAKSYTSSIPVNYNVLYANRFCQWGAFLSDSESKKRDRGHLLTVLVSVSHVCSSHVPHHISSHQFCGCERKLM